jgi:hypothetical protein
VFLAHHGYDEVHLAVSYGEIDYGLKLRASGLKVLWTPPSRCTIIRIKTRGLDHPKIKKGRPRCVGGVWGGALGKLVTDPSVLHWLLYFTLPFHCCQVPSNLGLALSEGVPPAIPAAGGGHLLSSAERTDR